MILAVGIGHEVKRGLFDLDAAAAGRAQRQQLLIHRLRHVPDDLAFVLVVRSVDIQEQGHHLRTACTELDRLAGLSLRDAPDFGIVERPVLDLSYHVWPSPAGIDLVQERAGWIVEPRRSSLLRLEMIAFKAGPALQRIVMPGAPCQVLIDVKIAVCEHIEPGAFLVADHYSHAGWKPSA